MPLKFSVACGRALASFLWLFIPAKRKRIAIDNARECLNVEPEEAE